MVNLHQKLLMYHYLASNRIKLINVIYEMPCYSVVLIVFA